MVVYENSAILYIRLSNPPPFASL